MNRPKKLTISGNKLTVFACIGILALMGTGLLLMYAFTGYYPVLLLGILQLLPVIVQLILLLPVTAQPVPPVQEEADPDADPKKQKRRAACQKAQYRRKLWYFRQRSTLVAVLAGLVTLGMHILFWKLKGTASHSLNYLIPVLLAVMFVVHIVLEKWCAHQKDAADNYAKAQLQSLCSCGAVCRVGLLLTVVAAVLCLLNLYDAISVLLILLRLLFVFATAMLIFSLVVRLVRKELDTRPEILLSFHGMDSDMNILTYLEENTGITMRSLWSLQLIKRLLPGAILGIALLLWLSTGLIQIESYQQGALFRFGKLTDTALQPGFHLTLPWPLDQTEVYNTQSVNKLSIGYTNDGAQDNIWTESHGGEEYRLLLGGGEEIVSINLVLEYRIEDLMSYIRCSASPESLLQAQAYEIVTARTISTDLNTLLAADREQFSESFRQELSQKLTEYNTGLTVVNVVLESIHPPVEIALIYQDMIGAGIDAEYLRLYAQNSANQTVMAAKETATKAIAEAEANYYKQVGTAQAAVTEFMAAAEADAAYRNEYRFQKYIKAITQAYGGATLIIAGEGVDTKNIYLGSLTKTEQIPAPQETTPIGGYEGEYIDEENDPI